MNQSQKAELFTRLHSKGTPVILYNVWDPGSAKIVAEAGAKAIATGSAPVAMSQGYPDGEHMPMADVIANIGRIVAAVALPVTLDFESAYAAEPETVADHFSQVLDTGVIGCNFEDQIIGGNGLYAIDAQAKRIAAMRAACEAKGIPAFINARTDIYLKARAQSKPHTRDMLEEAITRAAAFAEAGASGFFAPGLLDIDMIAELCERVSLPVNIIALPGAPENKVLAAAGVARISYGPVPYRQMAAWLDTQAKDALHSL